MTITNYKGTALGILITIVVCWFLFRGCNKPEPVVADNGVYDSLRINEAKSDSFKTVVVYRDSIRVNSLVKWRTVTREIHDTLYHEIIAICDTLVYHDSLAIEARDKVISQDSNVKRILFKIIEQKNDSIGLLSKQVRREKWLKRGVIALWVLREGVGVASRVKP